MEEFTCYEVCRVCATPKTIIPLTSLFDGNGEKAKILQLISGIDISIDEGKRNAMICDGCFERVKQAHIVRTEIIDSEAQYFKILRDEEEQEAGELRAKQEVEEAGNSEELSVKVEGQEAGGSRELNVHEESIGTKQEDDATDYSMEGDEFGLHCHLSTDRDGFTEGQFKCKHCSKIFFFKSNLDTHKVSHKSRRENGASKADPTKKSKPNQVHLNTFLKSSLVNHKDQYPGGGSKSDAKPKNSLKGNAEMLKLQKMIARTRGSGAKCKICGKTFEDKAALFYHRLSNHADTTDAHFQCHRCLKMFHFESHLREHLVNHRGIQNWLKCPEMDCGRFLQSEFHLTQHMISHSDVRPFACWCTKDFKFSHNLSQHQSRSHPEAANHSRLNCPVEGCMQSFDHQFDLHQHFIVHPGYRPFYNSKCDKTEARLNHSPTMQATSSQR